MLTSVITEGQMAMGDVLLQCHGRCLADKPLLEGIATIHIHTLSAEDTEVEQGLVGFKTPQIIKDNINVLADNRSINIIRLQVTNAR